MDLEKMVEKSVEISTIMKHLSHNKRLMLLCHLIESPQTVGELSEACGLSQSQTSQFLKRMELEGLLSSEREGTFIHYQLKDQRLELLMKQIKKIFC